MSAKNLEVVVDPTKPTIVTRREVDAPRALVYAAFTDPAKIVQWLGPASLVWVTCENDLRVGGSYRWVQRGESGAEFAFRGTYLEVVPNEKIVRTFVFEAMPDFGAEETLTLEEHDGKTTITTLTVHKTMEARDGHVAAHMEAGMIDGYARLDDLLATGAVAPFTITREFAASQKLLWDLHTKPELIAQWYGPSGSEVIKTTMDFRVGGTHHYGLRMPDGSEMWGKQVYRVIAEPHTLVLLQSFSNREGEITAHPMAPTWPREMLSRTRFEELPNGRSRLHVSWTPYRGTDAERATFEGARAGISGGFEGMFVQLDTYLATLEK